MLIYISTKKKLVNGVNNANHNEHKNIKVLVENIQNKNKSNFYDA